MARFRGVELADLTLSGDRVDLRRWVPGDAGRVLEVMQHRSMREFLVLPDPYDRDCATEYVCGSGHEGRDDGTGLGSAVVERSSGRVVGSAALRLGGDPEIGFWIAPDARGHGYAAEATRMLAGWARELRVPRVELHCDVRNLASARTALAAGFGYEGIARHALRGRGAQGGPARRGDEAVFARTVDDPGDRIAATFPDLPGGALSDGVLAMRVLQPSDAAAYLKTEDEVTLHWSFEGTPRTAAEVTRAATRSGLLWLVGREARFALQDIGSGAFAGELQLRLSGPPQIGSLGYVVHPRFRGRGYTTRALRLVTAWAFDVLDLARLELGAKVDNAASQHVARAAGFRPEGVQAHRLRNADGSFADEACFALVNPRYR